ncbi:MAG: glycoside hydrolase family 99-like domain-containing protein [Caulobacteraceae bacterium]
MVGRAIASAEDFEFCYRVLLLREPEIDIEGAGRGRRPLSLTIVDFLSSNEFRHRVIDPAISGRSEPAWSPWLVNARTLSKVPRFLGFDARVLDRAQNWAEYFSLIFKSQRADDLLKSAIGADLAGRFKHALRHELNARAVDQVELVNLLGTSGERVALAEWRLHHLKRDTLRGERSFVVVGTQPQMRLTPLGRDEDVRLEPGCYQILFTVAVNSGAIQGPVLYADPGNGFFENKGARFEFFRLSETEWCCNFVAKTIVHRLRLDPTELHCDFDIVRLEILKVSSSDQVLGLNRSGDASSDEWSMPAWPSQKGLAPEGEFQHAYWMRVSASKAERDNKLYAALSLEPVAPNAQGVKVLAYYLPQFYPFPENDKWWGRGFTEWTNVSKANPQFVGHYQPRLPGELGFYDLRVPEVIARQIELAKLYGIGGFCYYYYWFDGKRLLDRPLDMFLSRQDEAFDFPFCLCWANENWTRRWDGAESDVLMKQNHSVEDHRLVIKDLMRYIKDRRYITVDGKPMIIVYRPDIIDEVSEMLTIWRAEAVAAGLPGLHLVATNAFNFEKPEDYGFDALCEFPPHELQAAHINNKLKWYNADNQGDVFDYQSVVSWSAERLEKADYNSKAPRYPGVMVAWDNEARKPTRGNVFHDSTPAKYRDWLARSVNYTVAHNSEGSRFVFVNAWNEWAEGAYLEPDQRLGYAYLAATGSVLRSLTSNRDALEEIAKSTNQTVEKAAKTAVCLHIFYDDLIDEFLEVLEDARRFEKFDLIVSIPDTWRGEALDRLVRRLKPTRILVERNIGRDVAPFLRALRVIREMGYEFGCKIHSKKSSHMADGARWRSELIEGLLSPGALAKVGAEFFPTKIAGLAAPVDSFMAAYGGFVVRDNLEKMNLIMSRLGAPPSYREFVAGTMFWFRVEALAAIDEAGFSADDFDPEMGQIDATLAHAFERIFVPAVEAGGWRIVKYEVVKPGSSTESDD